MTDEEWEDMADAFTARRFAKDDSFWFGWINGRFAHATEDERTRAVRAAMQAVGAAGAPSGVVELLAAARRLRTGAV